MIIQTFDNGWGPEFPIKQLENAILKPTLDQLHNSDKRVVVINSTWYTTEYHQTVLQYLRANTTDYIVLVSMLDFAITQPGWYEEFDAEVIGIGYYSGAGQLDFWALFLDQNFCPLHTIELCRIDLVDRPFMCLNRKPHWHRQQLYQQLCERNLQHVGLVSMGSNSGQAVQKLDNDVEVSNLAPNSGADQTGILNDISSLGNMSNWTRCFLNVVTETAYNINRCQFVSEKIYKPILGMRPFFVYDPDGASKWLHDRKFVTYYDDFTDITNMDLTKPANVAPFLSILSEQPRSYWQKKLVDLNQKIVYNKQQFYKYVDDQKLKVQKGILCPI
jgi:hypothetical protein